MFIGLYWPQEGGKSESDAGAGKHLNTLLQADCDQEMAYAEALLSGTGLYTEVHFDVDGLACVRVINPWK